MLTKPYFKTTLLLIPFLILLTNCSNEEENFLIKKELELVDSLETRMQKLTPKLDIDYEEIKERIEEMDMDIMKMKMTDIPFTAEMGSMMDRYVSIVKLYKRFYEPFKNAKSEEEEITAQLIALKESVLKQEYSKEKFKAFYKLELEAIKKLEKYTQKHIQPVLDMEMDYRRIQGRIDKFLYADEIEENKSK